MAKEAAIKEQEETGQKVKFPKRKKTQERVFEMMEKARENDRKWRDGKTFSLVFYPGEEIEALIKKAYTTFFFENGLNPTAFLSLKKFETEVVSMSADLMNGDSEAVGNMTSGGTESILCAVKAAKNYGERFKGIKKPEMVVPMSVHPAFDKAANYFGIKLHHVPVRESDMRCDVEAMEKKVSKNTIMIVGSAPAYPHGVVDPISDLGKVAEKHDLWLHVDACVGGYMLPWVERLGYKVPLFDFRVPQVSSMSMDLHKYGYAAKGASCVLYRNSEKRKQQYFVYTEWTGGIYASPSVSGTRPGGSIAAAWAILNYLGEEGYMRIAKGVMKATEKVKAKVTSLEDKGIAVISDPELSLVSIKSTHRKMDIFGLGDELGLKGWHIDKQQDPDSLHFTISHGNVEHIDQFLLDLEEAVEKTWKASIHKTAARATRTFTKGMSKILNEKQMTNLVNWLSKVGGGGLPKRTAAMYGLMGELPNQGDVDNLILDMLDGLNRVE